MSGLGFQGMRPDVLLLASSRLQGCALSRRLDCKVLGFRCWGLGLQAAEARNTDFGPPECPMPQSKTGKQEADGQGPLSNAASARRQVQVT